LPRGDRTLPVWVVNSLRELRSRWSTRSASCFLSSQSELTTFSCFLSSRSELTTFSEQRSHLAAQLLRSLPLWCLGDHAHDWLGVAGADVDPAVGPVQAQPVQAVRPRFGPAPDKGLEQGRQALARDGVPVLDDVVGRQLRRQLAQLPAGLGHQAQDQ